MTAADVAAAIARLEQGGAFNVSVASVGDQYLISYDEKPSINIAQSASSKGGRPPKTETR